MNTLIEDKEVKMEELGIEEYLNKIGFEKEDIETILEYANNEIERKILHEKIK